MGERKAGKEGVKALFSLFVIFLKIGAFTFGGGYAMIPLIQKEVSEKKKWITDDDILEIVAIAESTPGPIAVNAATFVGYRVGGFFGALLSTLGVVLPSFVIILAISAVLDRFSEIKAVKFAFSGIRAGVLALIIKALVSMYKKSPKNFVSYALTGFAFIAAAFLDANILFVIVVCALLGLMSFLLGERRKK